MVLQQDQEVAIWGSDTPGQSITVATSWEKTEKARANSDGQWKVWLPTPVADGKKHQVTVEGTGQVKLENVMLGEVWFASGQSNMAMRMKGIMNQPVWGSNEAILHTANSRIRMFTVERNGSDNLLNDVEGNWEVARPEMCRTLAPWGISLPGNWKRYWMFLWASSTHPGEDLLLKPG